MLDKQISEPFIVLATSALITILSIVAYYFYGLPPFESFKFVLAVFFLFYIPGNLILSLTGIKKATHGGGVVVSVGIGTVLVPVIYFYFRHFALSNFLLLAFFVFTALLWCVLTVRRFLDDSINIEFSGADLVVAILQLLLVLVLLHLSHFTDIRLLVDGFMIRNTYMTETIFHQGIINALRHTWPPPALYAGGAADLSYYHLNMHLQIELLDRIFAIRSLYLIYFYVPFLYFILLVALPYQFVRQIGGNQLHGFVAGALIFGAGFSFLPGVIGITNPIYPWTLFFTSTIWSLFTLNGYIPALIAFFIYVWFLGVFFEKADRRILVLIALVSYGAFGLKSSMGLQIAAISLLTGFLMITVKHKRKEGISLSIASLVMIAIMFLDIALLRSGMGNNIVAFAPFNLFKHALKQQGLSGVPVLFYPILFSLYLVGAFGLRALGLLFVKKIIWKRNEADWLVVFLVCFVFGGYLISEFLFIGDPLSLNETGINNAKWFFTQSLVAAWFLLFVLLLKWMNHWKRNTLILLALICLAAPSTVQFLNLRYDANYVSLDSDDMRLVKFLDDVQPDAVVLHPLNKNRPALASNFAGKSSVVNIFRSFISEADHVTERVADVHKFFDIDTSSNERSEVLKKYNVNYVYSPSEFDSQLSVLAELDKILSNSKWVLFHVKE